MTPRHTPVIPETPFVNELRLSPRQWVIAGVIILLALFLTPRLWPKVERFDTGPDYRIPYSLSKDYWLYDRWLRRAATPETIVVLGDSVVWGEYVLPDRTWSHFLSQQSGQPGRFVNGGVNGLFPLALEGLIDTHGGALRNRKIILQCNLLWLSSPKADLSAAKEEKFNHAQLVPQFSPRIPCYKAGANERLGAIVGRNLNFDGWVDHLQNAYFGQKSILNWTLQDDGNDPPNYPNSYRNPFAQITLAVPAAPPDDPQRGPASPRHKAWSASGGGPAQFEWVELEKSLQWEGFRNVVKILRERGNDVFVVLGPFNEHMIAPESRPGYAKLRDGIATWLQENQIPHLAPAVLPSQLYADASHPLTEGYDLLARETLAPETFQQWLRAGGGAGSENGKTGR